MLFVKVNIFSLAPMVFCITPVFFFSAFVVWGYQKIVSIKTYETFLHILEKKDYF